jgi:hypothetical protein
MTKLIAASRNFSNAPKNVEIHYFRLLQLYFFIGNNIRLKNLPFKTAVVSTHMPWLKM